MSAMGYLFAFLGFALSPIGLFAFLLGAVLYLVIPVVPKITGYFHAFARLHLWVGTRMLKRAAFVVTPQGDLLLKKLTPDDAGTERIEFEETTKEFEDPTNALHWWYGIPFAIADEVHGILIDPRHAAVGMLERGLRDRDHEEAKATASEVDSREVIGWQHSVCEFARKTHKIVDLGAFRHLLMGSERAEDPDRAKTFYQNSRLPYKDKRGEMLRWVAVVAAVMGPFIAVWLLVGQLGVPRSTDIVAWGSGIGIVASLRRVDWLAVVQRVLVSIVVLAPLPAIYAALFIYVSPLLATFLFIMLGAGFWALPIGMLVLGRLSGTVANAASGLAFRLGFAGFDRPIFEWTQTRYRVRELSSLADVDESKAAWYGFAGQLVGFTFEPGAKSWERGVVPNQELESKMIASDDPNTNIPADLRIWDGQVRGQYGSLIPKVIDDAMYYVYTPIILEQFAYAATGGKTAARLDQAKDEHGESNPLSGGRLLTMVLVGSIFSLGLGVFVFLL